jgi:hypothetical protein
MLNLYVYAQIGTYVPACIPECSQSKLHGLCTVSRKKLKKIEDWLG